MKTIAELHVDHSEIASDIKFLKKEIDFLIKLLKNCYSVSINTDKIKLLDGYWMGFEENISRLDSLLEKVYKEERELAGLYQDSLIDGEKTLFNDEDSMISEFYKINKAVKTLKESFYGYMSGCWACNFKNN